MNRRIGGVRVALGLLLVATALPARAGADPLLAYSTYIGGSDADSTYAMAVDDDGNVYVAGLTRSIDFPTTPGVLQAAPAGGGDAFVTNLDRTGAIVYSTYLGGSRLEWGLGIVVDGAGNAYVAGYTESPDFPTSGAYQPQYAGGPGGFLGDLFVAKLDPSGSNLAYSTYLGGSGGETMHQGMAVDDEGSVYVSGYTSSFDFPTPNGAQRLPGLGLWDAFVAKLAPSGASLVYGTYLGGAGPDTGWPIAIDEDGRAHVAGWTSSPNFPTVGAAQQLFGGGPWDGFVTRLSAGGSSIEYSTYLGGVGEDHPQGLALDGSGAAYLAGRTSSRNFPTKGAMQASHAGGPSDAFVSKLAPSGDSLVWSTYLGGSRDDQGGRSIAVDEDGAAYVAGVTDSRDFPLAGPLQAAYGGGTYDGYVAVLNPSGGSLTFSTYVGGSGEDGATSIGLDDDGSAFVSGFTNSPDFPTAGAARAYRGSYDGFVARIR